jgi:hypothetical protein
VQVRLQVQRQLAQALFKLSVEFRKDETRFLNKMEQQKGFAAGSSIGLIEDEGHALGASDPGFTESQIQKVRRACMLHAQHQQLRCFVRSWLMALSVQGHDSNERAMALEGWV